MSSQCGLILGRCRIESARMAVFAFCLTVPQVPASYPTVVLGIEPLHELSRSLSRGITIPMILWWRMIAVVLWVCHRRPLYSIECHPARIVFGVADTTGTPSSWTHGTWIMNFRRHSSQAKSNFITLKKVFKAVFFSPNDHQPFFLLRTVHTVLWS